MCCDPSSEASRRDGSDEGSQHMVSMRNKENYHQLLPLIWSSEDRFRLFIYPKSADCSCKQRNTVEISCIVYVNCGSDEYRK